MPDLERFRADTREWLSENCPPGARGPGEVYNGSSKIKIRDPDTQLWVERMVAKGWTCPLWPKKYGGGGLSKDQYVVLLEEMRRIDARPALAGFGTSMIFPPLPSPRMHGENAGAIMRIADSGIPVMDAKSAGRYPDLADYQTTDRTRVRARPRRESP